MKADNTIRSAEITCDDVPLSSIFSKNAASNLGRMVNNCGLTPFLSHFPMFHKEV
jgi:hypothetical protein